MHEELLQSYLAGGRELTEVLDDGYFMQNVGHHLVTAKRFRDLKTLLTNVAWLECKLHSYGVASVVADYRRWASYCSVQLAACICSQHRGTQAAEDAVCSLLLAPFYWSNQPHWQACARLLRCLLPGRQLGQQREGRSMHC